MRDEEGLHWAAADPPSPPPPSDDATSAAAADPAGPRAPTTTHRGRDEDWVRLFQYFLRFSTGVTDR